jgi:YkoY family integral membrane protein
MIEKFDQIVEASHGIGPHTILILTILVGLEAVLSADNAIALAALVQGLNDVKLERRALNLGLIAAFVMRMGLIFTATWVIRYWQVELLGALYLLWLAGKYFFSSEDAEHHHHGPRFDSLWQAIPLIAITDLAFSLDSVTTAIALADDRWLVIIGGIVGIITLRFLAELFIRWLQDYRHLQDAGYLTVTLVGARLLMKVINEQWVIPEWLMISAIAAIFLWGFSVRNGVSQTDAPTTNGHSPDPQDSISTVVLIESEALSSASSNLNGVDHPLEGGRPESVPRSSDPVQVNG